MSETAESHSPRCATCGAPVAWDAERSVLACAYCGATRTPAVEGRVEERPLDALRGKGYGVRVHRIRCEGCGATLDFDPGVIASRCPFCASSQIAKIDGEGLAPESVLPFSVPAPKAEAQFARWIRSLWFRPNDLKRLAKLRELRGVYLPFFTFDASAESDWRAEAGYHYWETESYSTTENGRTVVRTRQVQRTRWVPASGSRNDRHDDELVYASQGLPRELVRAIEPFRTGELLPWSPDFLAGWAAEEAAFGVEQGWAIGQQQLDAEQQRRCAGDVPGDTHRNLEVRTLFTDLSCKHALLPIYVCAYAYRDRIYRFLVNGQTGEVSGEAPWSWVKITLAVLAGLVLLLVLAAVGGGDRGAIH